MNEDIEPTLPSGPEHQDVVAPLMAPPPASGAQRQHRTGRRAWAVGSALTSRGAGWGVAAALAGVIAGFAIGRASTPSATGAPVAGAVPVAGSAPVAGAVKPGQRLALTAPGTWCQQAPPAACGLIAGPGSPVGVPGPGVHVQVIGPARRQVVFAPGGRRTVILGPGGLRKFVMHMHGRPGGQVFAWLGGVQAGPAALPWPYARVCQVPLGAAFGPGMIIQRQQP